MEPSASRRGSGNVRSIGCVQVPDGPDLELVPGFQREGGEDPDARFDTEKLAASPIPVNTRANDLWRWHVRIEAPELHALTDALIRSGTDLVSPGVVELPGHDLGVARGAKVRDPTGHALMRTAPRTGPMRGPRRRPFNLQPAAPARR